MTWSGALTGLDYAAARSAVLGAGLQWERVFAGLRLMEHEVLAAQREQRERHGSQS